MSGNKDLLWLTLDDALITLGAQFREVALGILITQLNPHTSSYAWYFLAGSVPGFLMAQVYGWASRRWPPRLIMSISYIIRIVLVIALWRTANFWIALIFIDGIATGGGFYAAAQSHYIAVPNSFQGTQSQVVRLRQSTGLMQLAGPLLAGAILAHVGSRHGFLVCAFAYAFALLMVSRLSKKSVDGTPQLRSWNWRPDRLVLIMALLSFLTWIANSLALAYLFHILHRQEFGYGLVLSLWGGSGLIASYLFSRMRKHTGRWIGPLFAMQGLCWLALWHGVSFAIFAGLGAIEGLVNWLVQDILVTEVLAWCPEGEAGIARSRIGAYTKIGAIAGTATVLLMPSAFLIRPAYGLIGLFSLGAGLLFLLFKSV